MKCSGCGYGPKIIDLRISPWRCKKCGRFRMTLANGIRNAWGKPRSEQQAEDGELIQTTEYLNDREEYDND